MRSASLAPFAVALLVAAAGCQNSPSEPGMSPAAAGGTLRTLVDVPVDLTVTTGYTGTWNWAGQSFTVPAGTTMTGLRFNWYTRQQEATAFGNLYLLESEFLGVPGQLSPATPGFVARAEEIVNGVYVFPATAQVSGGASGKRYWVYTDTQGSFVHNFDEDRYAHGDLYVTGYPTNPFRISQASGRMVNGVFVPAPPGVRVDANFRIQGMSR